jgi:hypothetical protein
MRTVTIPSGHGHRHRPTAVTATLALDAVGAAMIGLAVSHAATDGPREGFFDDLAPALLLLGGATLIVLAGVVAVVALVRGPLRTRVGRCGTIAAIAGAVLIPGAEGAAALVAWVVGAHLPEGWGEPIAPVWLASNVLAITLGLVAREPGRRGLLLLPAVVGAFVLTFWVGELLGG